MTAFPGEGTEDLRDRLESLLRAGRLEEIREELRTLHPSDVADLIETLDSEEDRVVLMQALPAELASEALAEMDEEEDPGELLAALDLEKGAELLRELEYDDAVDLVGDLEPEERAAILAALPIEDAGEIRGLLRYDEESAGGLMDPSLVRVTSTLTAGQAIAEVRRQGREVEDFYTVFVVDEEGRLQGTVPLDDLILADPLQPVAEIVEPVIASVLPSEDQEEVGRLMSRYNLVSIPVVDETGVLLGRITFDDVLDVMEAEQTEDILRMAGTSEDEELRGSWWESVRARLPWLTLNLLTATIGASVVYAFSDTLENVVILAAIMPVVAGLGGNAGSQAVAVTVRRLALASEVGPGRFSALTKEILVGMVNGAVLGAIVSAFAVLVGGDPLLGPVVFLAMWGNQTAACFAGSFIPSLLDRFGVDPAVGSSVFVTALTDFLGFFFLLGLGSAILL